MKTVVLGVTLLVMGCSVILNAQEPIGVPTSTMFQEGTYATLNDFTMGTPTDSITDYTLKIGVDSISHRFYDTVTKDRLRKVFAISKDGFLYFRMKDILKHMAKEDQGQLKDDGDYHIKAKDIGSRYVYFEDYFTSSAAALWGGAIATAASRRLKGMVYDQNSRQFNLFKNAKDFETYIARNHPEYMDRLPGNGTETTTTKRKKHLEDIAVIRTVIFEINQKSRDMLN